MTILVLLTAISGVASLALTLGVLWYAAHHKILDHPVHRSSHSVPTPRGGGLAVIAAATIATTFGVALHLVDLRHAVTLGSGALVLATVGWVDDTRGLNAPLRLAVQIAVAVWTVYMWNGFPAVSVGQATLTLGSVGFFVGITGIVWSVNLFNFMDGIDGLAGSQALLIFGAAAFLLWSKQAYSLSAIAAVLAASSAGFLVWNWPPAKIFLGDVGSGPLGYLIAAIAVESENTHSVPILAFATLSGVFIADATITLLRRFARGERPMEAHRDHAYQRLARSWGSHRAVTIAAGGITLLLSLMAVIATYKSALVLPALLCAAAVLGALLFATERRAPLEPRARESR